MKLQLISAVSDSGIDIEEVELLTPCDDGPRLVVPEVGEVLRPAGIRGGVLASMRKAAEKRIAGVVGQKRRRHYGHAASLVSACVACDRSPETARWAAQLRDEYRRFPALWEELDRRWPST